MSGATLAEQLGRVADLPAPGVAALWLGDIAVFADGDGTVQARDGAGSPLWSVQAHAGAVLSAALGKGAAITGGDDGRICAIDADGGVKTLAEATGKWVSALAAAPTTGAIVAGLGKEAALIAAGKGIVHRFEHPSTVAALAFEATGRRFAAAHYGGVTLSWASNPESRRKVLEWKGSHTGVAWSPNAKYVVTSMQENALHGWRLQDGSHFRMTGYPSKIRSVSFTPDGEWLATAGAPEVIAWPFSGPTGPVNREAAMLGQLDAPSSAVACNPKLPIVAAGSILGEVALFPLGVGARPVLVDPPSGARVEALAWSADGSRLAYATESGRAAVVDFSSMMPTARP